MYRSTLVLTGLAALLAIGVACSRHPASPTSPTAGSTAAGSGAASDGTTLKVTAPSPTSPVGDVRVQEPPPTLVAAASSFKYGGSATLVYHFQVFNAAGIMIEEAVVGITSYKMTSTLATNARYTWWVRAESGTAFGPWSPKVSFLTPEETGGYIRGNELYDPLINNKTIGEIHGPVTFIPGVGVRLETQESYISYQLQQTLTEGEFSLLVTDMPANTDGDKTKLFAMGEGYGDIVTNDRRMTVEKRGDPAGIVAWRFITGDDQVDTEGPERQFYNFQASETYFWEASWRNNFFNVLIREGGFNGRRIYEKGKSFRGRPYDPDPHVIYVGAPVGRSGTNGASVDHVTVRQVWVSSRPRLASINK